MVKDSLLFVNAKVSIGEMKRSTLPTVNMTRVLLTHGDGIPFINSLFAKKSALKTSP